MTVAVPEGWLEAGHVLGVHGVQGWVKIFSLTDPIDNILFYRPWQLGDRNGWRDARVLQGRRQGKGLVAQFEGLTDRNAAEALIGARIAIPQAALPVLESDEFYWSQLIGLRVVNQQQLELGVVTRLFETGGNDVLVVQGRDSAGKDKEHWLPWVRGQYVLDVDLAAGQIQVDWDPDF